MTGVGLMQIASIVGDGVAMAGLVVAVLGIGVSVFLWLRGRQKKGISYRLTAPRVVSVRPEAEDQISVVYEDRPVGDVRLVDLIIVSSGNLPIVADDFERPFSLELGPGAQVLTSEVVKTSPADLAPSIEVTGTRLIIDPLLLNPGDSLEVPALVSDLSEAERLDGRVAA